MKFYIKRDTSTDNSRYIVFSETYEEVYRISGKCSSSGEKLYISYNDKCVAKVRDTRIGLLRTCYVVLPDDSFHLVIANSRDKIKVKFHGVSLHIRGNLLEKSYDIMNVDNSVVACVCRRFSSMRDAIEININDRKYELLSIASAVCFDSVCTNDSLALQTI